MTAFFLPAAFVLLSAVPQPAPAAGDWPEFRGPTGQGVVAGGSLPVKWTATENVAWKQPIPGLGWSSPAVVAGRVYLTTAAPDKGGYALRVLCLDARGGKIL